MRHLEQNPMPISQDRLPVRDLATVNPVTTPDRLMLAHVTSRTLDPDALRSLVQKEPGVFQTALKVVLQKPDLLEQPHQAMSHREIKDQLPKVGSFLTNQRLEKVISGLEPWQRALVSASIEQEIAVLERRPDRLRQENPVTRAEVTLRVMSEVAAASRVDSQRYARVLAFQQLFCDIRTQIDEEAPDLLHDARSEENRLTEIGQGILIQRRQSEFVLDPDPEFRHTTREDAFRGRVAQILLLRSVSSALPALARDGHQMVEQLTREFPDRYKEIRARFGDVDGDDKLIRWTQTEPSPFDSAAERISSNFEGEA